MVNETYLSARKNACVDRNINYSKWFEFVASDSEDLVETNGILTELDFLKSKGYNKALKGQNKLFVDMLVSYGKSVFADKLANLQDEVEKTNNSEILTLIDSYDCAPLGKSAKENLATVIVQTKVEA